MKRRKVKQVIRVFLFIIPFLFVFQEAAAWGFFAHRRINLYSIFLLPPEMLLFYKMNAEFLTEHATDPDKRRYVIAAEGPRHYIDLDRYGQYPFDSLPRKWNEAVEKYSEDSLMVHGIVPWWIQVMLGRLTDAFRDKDPKKILKLSAEMGHYISDACVPLHANSNHNGQFTGQKGIHGLWESRVPELMADVQWDFFIGPAGYVRNPLFFTWDRVLESAAASDSVLKIEKELSLQFNPALKYSFELRNNVIMRQYSSAYCYEFDRRLGGMIERRMRQSIHSIASFWYTAWVNAGQPNLSTLAKIEFTLDEKEELEQLERSWDGGAIIGREH